MEVGRDKERGSKLLYVSNIVAIIPIQGNNNKKLSVFLKFDVRLDLENPETRVPKNHMMKIQSLFAYIEKWKHPLFGLCRYLDSIIFYFLKEFNR